MIGPLLVFILVLAACSGDQLDNHLTPLPEPEESTTAYDQPQDIYRDVDMDGALHFVGHWEKTRKGFHFVMDRKWREGQDLPEQPDTVAQ
jgi:hypothetical protein